MNADTDLYKALGIGRQASADDVRTAYRKLARELHPDVNPNNPAAEERFKQVTAAYEVLSDPEKRKRYDEFGSEGLREGFDPARARAYRNAYQRGSSPYGEGFDVDLGDLFGFGRRGRSVRGQDVTTTVEIDLVQALNGLEIEVNLPDRSGGTTTVRIPKGAADGDRLRVAGKGIPSPMGGVPGDLIIETRVRPHPHFRREGLDLFVEVPITTMEAVTGGSVEVPTPSGRVRVKIPPGLANGSTLRLKGKGVARGKTVGDLHVELNVHVPLLNPSDAVRDALATIHEATVGEVASRREQLAL